MRKRRKVLLLLACGLLAAVLLAVIFPRSNEPRYKGRPLSQWLAVYSKHAMTQTSPEFFRAEHAVRMIGTNALPFLLKWIRHEPPPWRRAAGRILPTSVWDNARAQLLINGPGYERAEGALLGYSILGSNAAPAVGDLVALMKDPTCPTTARRATYALSSLGAPAFPYMTAALSNPSQPHRDRVALCIGVFMAHEVGTNVCLPPLIAALSDTNPLVRLTASKMVKRLTPEAPTNGPPQ